MLVVTSFEYPWASWSTQVPPFPSIILGFRDLNVPTLRGPFSRAFTASPSSSCQTTLFASSISPLAAGLESSFLSLSPSPRANYSGGSKAPSAAFSPPWHSSRPALSSRREPVYCTVFSIFVPPFELYVAELSRLLHSFSFGSWVASRSSAPCFFCAGRRCRLPFSWSIQSS